MRGRGSAGRFSGTSARGPGGGPSPRNPTPRATSPRPGPRPDGGRPTARTCLPGRRVSGAGRVTSYMVTVAVPEGETAPDMFVLDMRDVPWDGSAGVTLTAAWEGHGMPATQSHAMAFNEFPVTRMAWPGQFPAHRGSPGWVHPESIHGGSC